MNAPANKPPRFPQLSLDQLSDAQSIPPGWAALLSCRYPARI
jgi:hypothetical protein